MTRPVSSIRIPAHYRPRPRPSKRRSVQPILRLHVTHLHTGPTYVGKRSKDTPPTSPGLELGPPPPSGTWKRWGYNVLKVLEATMKFLVPVIVFIAGRASFGVVKQLGPRA